VDGWHIIYTKAINVLWVDSWPRPKFIGRGENHLGRRVPSSQTSLYRSLWREYHVHRPLFTGCSSGLGIQGKCQVYWSLFTDPPLQMPSIPFSLYRSLPIVGWQKNKYYNNKILHYFQDNCRVKMYTYKTNNREIENSYWGVVQLCQIFHA
jgi:hypothetical protein